MQRRDFITRTGLASVLIGSGIPLGALCGNSPPRSTIPAGPRARDWVLSHYWKMHDLLSKGRRTMWLTGFTQPCERFGWTPVDKVPLELQAGFKEVLPIPGSLIFDDVLTYTYSEKETRVGRLRVDCLERVMLESAKMKLFLVELDGKPLGHAGLLSEEWAKDDLYSNWYCGIRTGDIAYRFQDAHHFGPDACRNAHLEIWSKKGARNHEAGIGC